MLKRIDLTSRSLVALIENGSCFAGFLAEIAVRLRSRLHDGRRVRRRQSRDRVDHADERQFRAVPDVERSDAPANALPRRAQQGRGGRRGQGQGARSGRSERARPRHLRLRRGGLGRRGPHLPRRARELLAGRDDGHGGQPALPRAGDDGNPHLRPADRLAELDFPTPERGRRERRAASATAPACAATTTGAESERTFNEERKR